MIKMKKEELIFKYITKGKTLDLGSAGMDTKLLHKLIKKRISDEVIGVDIMKNENVEIVDAENVRWLPAFSVRFKKDETSAPTLKATEPTLAT